MRLKIYLFLLFCIFFSRVNSQIAITEVYFDTPYNESLKKTSLNPNPDPSLPITNPEHHRGEFIELYNYSDEDISLCGWYIKDFLGVFYLPCYKTIKSGDFILIAYGKHANEDYFPEFFPTTAGKESKIIYQNVILLRNQRETIELGCTNFKGLFSLPQSEYIDWVHRGNEPHPNYIPYSYSNSNNFYSVQSLQLVSDYNIQDEIISVGSLRNYDKSTPNPLEANYKPKTVSLKNLLLPLYYSNYANLTWSENVLNITNNTCPITILKEEQTPTRTYTNGNKCFTYDIAGNKTDAIDCNNPSIISTTSSNGLTDDQLEEIKANITVAPNPTGGNVYIYWNGIALNKVHNLAIYSSLGTNIYNFLPGTGVNSVSFSLQGQLPGTYIANFTLNTGQVVTKNILKW